MEKTPPSEIALECDQFRVRTCFMQSIGDFFLFSIQIIELRLWYQGWVVWQQAARGVNVLWVNFRHGSQKLIGPVRHLASGCLVSGKGGGQCAVFVRRRETRCFGYLYSRCTSKHILHKQSVRYKMQTLSVGCRSNCRHTMLQ